MAHPDTLAPILACLEKNDVVGAERCCAELLGREPGNADGWHVAGVVEYKKGGYGRAVELIRKAIGLRPHEPQFHYNLGVILGEKGEGEAAEEAYREAVRLDPGHGSAANNLGNLLKVRGAFGEALRYYRIAAAADPGSGRALRAVGEAQKMIGDIEGAIASFREALVKDPKDAVSHSDLVFSHQYLVGIDAAKLGEVHREWDARHGRPGGLVDHSARRDAGRQIRLGFLSPDLGYHPVGIFLAPLLERIDRRRFHVTCYHDRLKMDGQTERIRAASDVWREVCGMSDDAVYGQIQGDKIDILFDLAGHTDDNRMALFARRAAPLQMTWGGYVGTTGLAAMDYIVCDGLHVPEVVEPHYTERPLRLAHDYIAYDPPGYAPGVGAAPSAAVGHVTFGCLNNPTKVNGHVAEVWSEILRKVPGSRLLFKYKGFDDPVVQERVLGLFSRHGIGGERIEMLGSTTHVIHLDAYNRVDVVLDPFPYSGGLTTCEALWMGVPTVTWPGDTFASRHSFAHMTNAGFTETVAQGRDDYVRLAVEWAGDVGRRNALRGSLWERVRRSPLCDKDGHAASFSREVERAWKMWCWRGKAGFWFREFAPEVAPVRVVEIGASPVDGEPVFACWRGTPAMELVSFEPNPSEFQKLSDPGARYLADAVGDGCEAVLRVCRAPGMTSLLEPDFEVLRHFHGFAEWSEVVKEIPVRTRRLDDVSEVEAMDYLVMDVQGSELAILENARRLLGGALVVQTEVNFVPFYKDQPLFAEIDRELREAGFFLHRFTPIVSRAFRPFLVNKDIYGGFSQQLWADAIYVRKFTEFGRLTREELLKVAAVLHDIYGSYDLVGVALGHIGEDVRDAYFKRLGIGVG